MAGVCVTGDKLAACGLGGSQCVSCSVGQICGFGMCGNCLLNSQCGAVYKNAPICANGICKSAWGITYRVSVTAAKVNQYNYNKVSTGETWDKNDAKGLPDPYVDIYVSGKKVVSSNYAADTLTPSWTAADKNYVDVVLNQTNDVKIYLYDYDGGNDDIIGGVKGPYTLQHLIWGGFDVTAKTPATDSMLKLSVTISPK